LRRRAAPNSRKKQLYNSPQNSGNAPLNHLQKQPKKFRKKSLETAPNLLKKISPKTLQLSPSTSSPNLPKNFFKTALQTALQNCPRNSAQEFQIAQMNCVSEMKGGGVLFK
jgi:hypothetical protein